MASTTENVFLDTEAFVDAGYNFETKRLVALRDLAAKQRIRIFLTEVTVREIRVGLVDAVESASRKRPPAILRLSQLSEVRNRWAPLNPVEIQDELLGQLESFMVAAQITVLPVKSDYLSTILDKYFDRRPPFGTGKNKAEFPDALAVEALLTWCSANDAHMSVVSRDGGVQACCSESGPLHGFPELPAFLDAVASEDELSSSIRDALETVWDDIDNAALVAFEEISFYLSDEDGEVESIEDVKVEPRDNADIIYLTPALATIEFPAVFTFTVKANYSDSASGSYDREDNVYMFRDVIDTTFQSSHECRVAVDVGLPNGVLHVQSASIQGSTYVGLRMYDEDSWD